MRKLRILTAVLSIAIPSLSQTPPAFEVTSVRPAKRVPGQRPNLEFGCANGRFVSSSRNLRPIILLAYGIPPFELTGLPPWANSPDAIFDIEAKADPATTDEECKLMLRALLVDRFKLATHRESKDIAAYALVEAGSGSKLHPIPPDSKTTPEGGVRILGSPVRSAAPGGGALPGWSMMDLANFLTGTPSLDGRPVFDRTGLKGIYEISLNFAFLPNMQPPRPEIFDALQEQLGLKLNSIKEPVEMLVIDRLERPDAN